MGHSKNRNGFLPLLVIGMVALFFSQAASARPRPDQETMADRVGIRYEVERPIAVSSSPFSQETRDVAPGRIVTVRAVVLDPADPHAAAYAVRLDAGRKAYIGVRDLEQLIQGGSVVRVDSGSGRSKKTEADPGVSRQPRATPLQAADLPRAYRTLAYSISSQLSDVLRGDFDLPMALMVLGTVFGLVWALWQVMGCEKTLSFLAIFPLLHWLLMEFPGSVSLVPFLALLLLFANLLGVWTFVRFAITLAGSAAVAYVMHATYEGGNGVFITLVSLAITALVGTFSLFLIRKTYGIERRLRQE